MQYLRLIGPSWAISERKISQKVLEGFFTPAQITSRNAQGYNAYYLPNHPNHYPASGPVDGTHIDVFEWIFIDFDLKSNTYPSKEAFLERVLDDGLPPTKIVDSGNGIHVYWKVANLDPMSYLRFQRRLMKYYKTDEAIGQLFQLMRLPGTINTKHKSAPVECLTLDENDTIYTMEKLNDFLPSITVEDEAYCQQHYDRTHGINQQQLDLTEEISPKFGKLLHDNKEAKDLWGGNVDDRSKADYRLGHLMLAADFTQSEAVRVLMDSAKAMERAPVHRRNYAEGIVKKIWTFEQTKDKSALSSSVADLLSAGDDETLKGKRFPAQRFFDGTDHGFRLSQVIGLCAGVGVGKTAIGLNLFKGFVERNPNYIHMFVSLEQPAREIAARWKKMCGSNSSLHSKVHVLSNYNDDGSYRNLSLSEIQDYILKFQSDTQIKVGCVCLDHIGVLRQEKAPGEFQGLAAICAQLKSFAIATNTLFVIQSQTSREKAGIGDLELFKDAAYGAMNFESFVDFLMVAWQPLKRCYENTQCPRITAYKFAKVRFKSKNDSIIEDQCYRLLFDQDTETLREMTQDEEKSFDWFAQQALKLRQKDRKSDLVIYSSSKPGGSTPNAQTKISRVGQTSGS